MERILSSEADSRLASQEILHILWDMKLHCCIHKSPSFDPLLCQLNPFHILTLFL